MKTVKRHSKSLRCFKQAFLEPYENAIKAQLSDHSSMTLKELLAWLANKQGLTLSISTLEALLRKQLNGTYDKLWRAIGQIMDQFHPKKCLNYFINSGYVSN